MLNRQDTAATLSSQTAQSRNTIHQLNEKHATTLPQPCHSTTVIPRPLLAHLLSKENPPPLHLQLQATPLSSVIKALSQCQISKYHHSRNSLRHRRGSSSADRNRDDTYSRQGRNTSRAYRDSDDAHRRNRDRGRDRGKGRR